MIKILIVVLSFLVSAEAQNLKISKKEPLEITAKAVFGNNKTKEITYVGDVILKHAENTLKAEKVIISADSEKITGEKSINFFDKDKTLDIKGEYVEYYKDSNYLVIKKSPVLASNDHNGVETLAKGEKMEFFQADKKAIISGNVEIEREDIKVKCGIATYDKENEKVILEGDPLVIKKQDKFKGDKITLFSKRKLLIADLNVTALIYVEDVKQ